MKATLAQQVADIASFDELLQDPVDDVASGKSKKTKKDTVDADDDMDDRDRTKARKFFQVKDPQIMYVTLF